MGNFHGRGRWKVIEGAMEINGEKELKGGAPWETGVIKGVMVKMGVIMGGRKGVRQGERRGKSCLACVQNQRETHQLKTLPKNYTSSSTARVHVHR